MKILVVGEGRSEIHEKALAKGFEEAGHEVEQFSWVSYFERDLLSRFQNRFLLGPKLTKVNRALQNRIKDFDPKLIFLYRPTHIFAATLRKAKKKRVWVTYNNDDPFSKQQPRYFWRHFFKSLPYTDHVFAYRAHNIKDYQNIGLTNVSLLRSWFIPEKDRPIALNAQEKVRFGSDVLFAGHFENDGRADVLRNIEQRGIKIRTFGPGWEAPALRGEDYVKALCGTKIALCFLSKLNRDTYTRRCFEIPATKTFLLSQYSADLANLYKEGEEAEFFRNEDELYDKIIFYLENETARKRIAEAGFTRVWKDGHDVNSRAQSVLSSLTHKLGDL